MAANIELIIIGYAIVLLYAFGIIRSLTNDETLTKIREYFILTRSSKSKEITIMFMVGTIGFPLFVWIGIKEIRFIIWKACAKFILTEAAKLIKKHNDYEREKMD